MSRKVKTLADVFGTERCMYGAGVGDEHRCPNPAAFVGPGGFDRWCADHRCTPMDRPITVQTHLSASGAG
jgi:hypothetical protein